MRSSWLIVAVVVLLAPTVLATLWFLGSIFFGTYFVVVQFVTAVLILLAVLVFALNFRAIHHNDTHYDTLQALQFYEKLFTNSPLPYLTITETGKVLTGNAAALQLLETTSELIGSIQLFQNFTHEEPERVAILIAKIKSAVTIRDVEMQLKSATGLLKWVSLSIHVNQATRQRFVTMVDITEKKRIDIAKSEFASLVTHQLRTPVAAMRWNTELLEQSLPQPIPAIQQKYLEKVKRNITRQLDLINDFLSVSKLETGTFETSPETINLTTYFDGIVDEYTGTIQEKHLVVDKLYTPVDYQITIDTRLFHIVTSNLLSNAVKYTPMEGRVVFGYEIRNDQCVVTVADTGIGIPKEDQARLFSKFFRATNAVKHRSEGTGLGLYIVKQSVEKLGGVIAFNSIENQGTTFQITLPLR